MNFEIFSPKENYTLTTRLKIEEVNERLSEKIRPKQTFKDFFRVSDSGKSYEGYILINEFKIRRIINYRNSFLPEISGLIYSIENTTHIKIEMKIPFWILVTTLLMVGILTVLSFVTAKMPNGFFSVNWQSTFLIPLISYLVIYLAFKLESIKSKKFLEKLLEAEQINS